MLHEPLQVLLAHDRWATFQLFEACCALTHSQLDRAFEIGHGSLRATLIHIVQVTADWDGAIRGLPPTGPIDGKSDVSSLIDIHARVFEVFSQTCFAGPTSDVLTPTRGPRRLAAPRGVLVTHILTHGTHHRAQALNMLRHLGVSPLPRSSVLEWMLTTESAQISQISEKSS